MTTRIDEYVQAANKGEKRWQKRCRGRAGLLYFGMSKRLINIDRRTPMLLPPDLRDWVPSRHMVHFILEAIERLDLNCFRINWRGSGSKQYPPSTLLALLVYCYATGRFSSRRNATMLRLR